MKFVVCKPLQHRCHHSLEAYFWPQNTPKPFGYLRPLAGFKGKATDLYKVPDAVPPIHAVSFHVATDKGPSKLRPIFYDNLQPIATRGKKACGTLSVDIGCSSKRAPLSVSYYNEISGGHIGSCRCSEEGLCRPSTAPVGKAPEKGKAGKRRTWNNRKSTNLRRDASCTCRMRSESRRA